MLRPMKKFVVTLIALVFIPLTLLEAQYFGRNKPRYRSFDFKVQETPHFDIHHYFENPDMVNRLSQWTEQWYDLHQEVLRDTFRHKNPLLFYANHADFQQTNAIMGSVSVSTGGVTEAFKNRVVMPTTFSNQQTYQVLGHELVHAFQFHIILQGDSTNLKSLANLPLWVVEGMAEYMSLGRVDPFTAMWMRDAILNDDVPSLKKMANPKYFPYRYGQTAISFLAGKYGDDVLAPFFRQTALGGVPYATKRVLQRSLDDLSEEWESTLKSHFQPYLADNKERFIGKKVLSKENSGRINVSPTLSPSGRYVIFLSEKDLFSTDLFLAEARSGEIVRKVASLAKDGDLDAINFIESAGTWSPDSKEFAFVGFKKGKNVLVIKDIDKGNGDRTLEIPTLNSFTNPVWSPDGREIIVTGSIDGQPDLYTYNIREDKTYQLTDDVYSEIHPNFSADGSQLVFSYDKKSYDGARTYGKYTYDMAIMDYQTKGIEILDIFHTADNINPSFDHEGNIYFVSDRDGYRNLYRYMPDSNKVHQMTDLLTGVSGISRYSPAITASRKRDRVMFTHYYDSAYSIYDGSTKILLNREVDPQDVHFDAGTLPINSDDRTDIVNRNLNNLDDISYVDASTFSDKDYKSKFKLDYNTGGIGVGTGNHLFGNSAQAAGSLTLLFSDLVGNNQLITSFNVNGDIQDFAGQASYVNRKHQLAWGGAISHFPQQFFGSFEQGFVQREIEGQPNPVELFATQYNVIRMFEDQARGFFHYPFSTTLRLEGGVGAGVRYFSNQLITSFYNPISGQFLGQEREKLEIEDVLNIGGIYFLKKGVSGNASIGLVGDNSYFGLTAPLSGHRFRLDAGRTIGIDDFWSFTADARKYVRLQPVTLAFRGMSLIRIDNDVLNSVVPIYIGQMGMVHGFDFFFNDPFGRVEDADAINPASLIGSKALIGNFEVRLPFTGPKSLALIGSKFFFSDLNFFFDGGIAFDEFDQLESSNVQSRPWIARTGLSMRVNLFGALILEPYYSWSVAGKDGNTFGLNLVPGW